MGRLRTAIQLAMRAGKPLRKAADIVQEGRAAWAAGRPARSGLTAASIADDMARNAAMRPNIVRSGGGGIVPTGGSSMVSSKGGALMRQGGITPYNQGGALMRQGSGAMSSYDPGGALARIAPPTSIVTMFAHPGAMKPQVDLSDYPDVPDPSMLPRDPIIPEMTPGFTPTTPDMLPPPMIPRSPVPVTPSMPEMPMTVPPNMELPDVMPLAPRMPTMPDMSMGRPDIMMPGFDVMFDHPDPTPSLMGLGIQDPGLLDALPVPEVLPTPVEPSGGFHYRTPHPMPLPAYRRGY